MEKDRIELVLKIKNLNHKILRRVEIELNILKKNNTNWSLEIDNMFVRLREGILDEIGDLQRFVGQNDRSGKS